MIPYRKVNEGIFMRISPVVLLILIISCTKKNLETPAAVQPPVSETKVISKPEACKFGLLVFNTTRRAPSADVSGFKKKPKQTGTITPPNATIYLDFDGQVVTNTLWNISGPINCAPANVAAIDEDKILDRVSEDFSPFNVVVTTDENVYNATSPQKRMRVIITETWDWFGVVGGTSYNNSFTWGNNTPCFVFSTLLSYNEKYIAEAISHEVGHTLNLQHQALYDNSGNFISEYNEGIGDGRIGWAPIMGIGYYRNVTTWYKGPTANGYNNIQDDVAIISNVLGLKLDENSEMQRSDKFAGTEEGIINNGSDIDYYYMDVKDGASIIKAEPKCLGNGEGANLALRMRIYNKEGVCVKSIEDKGSLSASVSLTPDKYFIGIESKSIDGQSRNGMLGRYTVSMN
jgi:hypothetical protein